jgi:DNA-directed RNA polymerase subunit RPC12/RpoP
MEDLLYICEVCGTVLEENPCRATCPNCGRTLDCSDLSALQANGGVRERHGEMVFVPRPILSDPPRPAPPASPQREQAPH